MPKTKVRVKQSTIDEIREMGIAAAVGKANSGNASPEFKEAVRRYFPNAKFGSKSKAAYQGQKKNKEVGSSTQTQTQPKPEKEVTRVNKRTSSVSSAAVERRLKKNNPTGFEIVGSKVAEGVTKPKKGSFWDRGPWDNKKKKKK